MGCSGGRPSDAKVELDFQEVFHQKVGNDLVTPRVLEIENVTSPAEDRLIYTLKFRFESNDEKIKAFIAKQERDLNMWGGFPDQRAVNFAKSVNGKEQSTELLFRKTGETWSLTEVIR